MGDGDEVRFLSEASSPAWHSSAQTGVAWTLGTHSTRCEILRSAWKAAAPGVRIGGLSSRTAAKFPSRLFCSLV